jgi:hypothetical protein
MDYISLGQIFWGRREYVVGIWKMETEAQCQDLICKAEERLESQKQVILKMGINICQIIAQAFLSFKQVGCRYALKMHL